MRGSRGLSVVHASRNAHDPDLASHWGIGPQFDGHLLGVCLARDRDSLSYVQWLTLLSQVCLQVFVPELLSYDRRDPVTTDMSDQEPESAPEAAQAGLALDGDAMADDAASKEAKKQASIERRRSRLVRSVHAFDLDTEMARVASVLSAYPDARDSDITLLLRYWQEHEGIGPDDSITPRDLYELPRLTSLTRARAAIQNELGLFKASTEVQEARGTLSDEERERARRRRKPSEAPVISVYADETGKHKDRLIVASVWVLVSTRELRAAWQARPQSDIREFHFSEMSRTQVEAYKDFTEFMLARLVACSFKCLSVPRPPGNPAARLEEMFGQLLVDGVQHELSTQRVALPRALQFWKDQDDPAADSLMCARLRNRMDGVSEQQHGGALHTDTFEPMKSHASVLMQLADLFAASLNRVLNEPAGGHFKEQFARWFLDRIGYRIGGAPLSDNVMHFDLGQGAAKEPAPGGE
jgi:hypothetical protein